MGMKAPTGSVNATLRVAVVAEYGNAGWKAGQGSASPFYRECSSGQACPACASQMSRGEDGGAQTLLGLAGSVTGNARLRSARNMSIVESRAADNADLIPGPWDSRGRALEGFGSRKRPDKALG